MGKFLNSCFNPANLQFFVYNELAADGYTILSEDYTKAYFAYYVHIIWSISYGPYDIYYLVHIILFMVHMIHKWWNSSKCYYEDKLVKYLENDCSNPAVIGGQITSDYSLKTVLFESDFPECIEKPLN